MSNWNANNFQVAEAEADADFAAAAAHQSRRAVAAWRQHAEQLAVQHDESMLEMSGRVHGQSVLKNAALKELERFDPTNPLLKSEYREEVYEAAHREEIARILTDRQATAERQRLEQKAAAAEARKAAQRKAGKQIIGLCLFVLFLILLYLFI